MQLQVRLLHCDAGSRVVLVSAREGERFLGSALGEAGHAEEAEDRARARLLASLVPPGTQGSDAPSQRPRSGAAAIRAEPLEPLPQAQPVRPSSPPSSEVSAGVQPLPRPRAPLPQLTPPPTATPATERQEEDPQDWSSELAELDLQMRRLGWDREREGLYLQRSFGHPSRERITVYADLRAYLQAIALLEPGCDPATAALPLRRSELLVQCNQLLQQLGWDGSRGRRFLEQHLGVSSRQQLKDDDLLRFNMLLEEETLQAASAGSLPSAAPSAAPPAGQEA
jgi:hypothetical protein